MAGNPGITCLFSDDNARELVMRVSLNDNAKGADKEGYDQVAALKALEQTLIHKPIKGMDQIRKVSMHARSQEQYNTETQAFEKKAIWVLDTDGSNLAEILANPNVDSTRTVSNDPREIYAVLGVEAARNSLYLEIMDVIKESSVNYRHVSLLIDTMTHRGNLMSIDRHGINRGDVGPLAKSSFEETTDMLINASVFSDYDKINGVSANIMLGQLPPCGTGDSEILLDEEAYMSLLSSKNKRKLQMEAIKEEDDHDQVQDNNDDNVCGYSTFNFNTKPIQKQEVGGAFRLQEVDF
jgi:DNA-directed RNA polymerase II subunit RPB1